MANPGTGRFSGMSWSRPDLEAATKFYAALLGWTFRDNPHRKSPLHRRYRPARRLL